jgi:hypothetical protein
MLENIIIEEELILSKRKQKLMADIDAILSGDLKTEK